MHPLNKAIGAPWRRNVTGTRLVSRLLTAAVLTGAICVAGACGAPQNEAPREQSLEVMASAYNSTRAQTNDEPTLTAWGDTLAPGMRVIAVSRDLISLGLDHGTAVRIEGLEGEYVVRDKMSKRWEKKIDIYMGNDVAAAREWGKREVTIHWSPE